MQFVGGTPIVTVHGVVLMTNCGALPFTTPSPGVVSPSLASASLRTNRMGSLKLSRLATVKSHARQREEVLMPAHFVRAYLVGCLLLTSIAAISQTSVPEAGAAPAEPEVIKKGKQETEEEGGEAKKGEAKKPEGKK